MSDSAVAASTCAIAANGSYTVSGLAAGSYDVYFDDAAGTHVSEYFGGYDGGLKPGRIITVKVGDGASVTGIDQALPLGGSISGTITDAGTGSPLDSASGSRCVEVFTYYYNPQPVGTCQWAADGKYSFHGVPAGDWTIAFVDTSGQYVEQYFDAAANLSDATTVAVAAGSQSSGVNAALARAASISGAIDDAAGNVAGDPGVCIDVQPVADTSDVSFGSTCGPDSSTGAYSVGGLPNGTYRVQFTDHNGRYLGQWYDKAGDRASAAQVPTAVASPATGINSALVLGGSITGTVTDSSGNPVTDLCVLAFASTGGETDQVQCGLAPDGSYDLGGLLSGDYKVLFSPSTVAIFGGNSPYLDQWYDGTADGSPSEADASSVSVTLGQQTAGIDAALQQGGAIAGVISDVGGGAPAAISNLCVRAYRVDTNGSQWQGSTCVAPNGSYQLQGLPSGTYDLEIDDSDGTYLPAQITSVSVTQGTTTTANTSVTRGGAISGTVTDANGNPINDPNLCVEASDDADGQYGGTCSVAADGTYTIQGLRTGDYVVTFDDNGGPFIPQFYDGAATAADATTVHVAAPNPVTGIDAHLVRGAAITGLVTDPASQPLPDVCVRIYSASDLAQFDDVSETCTDQSGAYAARGLPNGSYVVEFVGEGTYVSQYYDDKFSADSADLVTVSGGSDVTGINAAMVVGGSIHGRIIAGDTSLPLQGACAQVYAASDVSRQVARACADSQGNYAVTGLPSGSYLVRFGDSKTTYLHQWYDSRTSRKDANLIAVTVGQETDNINASLVLGGAISGTVTSAAQPVANFPVFFFDATTGRYVARVYTKSDGTYRSAGLPAGSYVVDFYPYSYMPYAEQYYDGAATFGTATAVPVTAGAEHTGVDASLVQANGLISGHIQDSGGNPVADACVIAVDANQSFQASGCTNDNGDYSTGKLSAGTYKVEFTDSDESGVFSWWNGQPDFASATPVDVTDTGPTTGIDATIDPRTISGTVTDSATGKPISGACIVADGGDTGGFGGDCTDDSGAYSIRALVPGSYQIGFNPDYRYLGNGLDQASQYLARSGLTEDVTSQNQTAADVQLVAGNTVSGAVTDAATGNPLSNVCIQLVSTDGSTDTPDVCTGNDGLYRSVGVPAGSYEADFTNGGGRYIEQWFDGKPDQASATPITFGGLGANQGSVNAAMVLGGNISGTVTDASNGHPIQNACVTLYTPGGSVAGSAGCTDSSGAFGSAGFPSGTYVAKFAASGYTTQWYDGQADLAHADPITIAVGATTRNINAQLQGNGVGATGSTIQGTVAESGTSAPVAGAIVQICPVGQDGEPQTPCTVVTTSNDGGYSAENLVAASYLVTVNPGPEDNADIQTSAGPVAVDGDPSTVVTEDVAMNHLTPPPAGTSVGGPGLQSSGQGVPVIYWDAPTTLTTQACAGGTVTYAVSDNTGVFQSGPMTEGPAGTYTATVPAADPHHGHVTYTITVKCGSAEPQSQSFDAYIDPSGKVVDQNGDPVAGATVTLEQASSPSGPFTAVPNGSAVMSPSNRVNPDATGSNGLFGWDVLAGYYKVMATKSGCSTSESAVLTIPPPATNLKLAITCGGSGPSPGPTGSATPTPTPTPTGSGTPTPTPTPTGSGTPTPTPTGSGTPTPTPTGAGGGAPSLVAAPTVSGVPRVGHKLACDVTYANYDGYGTAWLRDGRRIPGSESSRYSLKPTDLGHQVSCETAAYNLEGGWSAISQSASVTVKLGRSLRATVKPHVVGDPVVGSVLTAHHGSWSPGAVRYRYAWWRNGSRIHGADGRHYTLRAADAGERIRVTVRAYRHGYRSGWSASHPLQIT